MRKLSIIPALLLSGALAAQILGPIVSGGKQCCTYYVDPSGSDSANGLTPATAWQTIAKVNGTTLTPGQSVGFARGGVWREQLTPGQSGTAGSPITFGAYGSGATPILTGADIFSWTTEAQAGTSFTSDANLQAYYYLENNWNDGTANANTLTASATPPTFVTSSPSPVQGTYSAAFVSASSEQGSRTNANLSAAFPGKNTYQSAITVGGWIQTTSSAGVRMNAITKAAAWQVRKDSNNYWQFILFDSGGTGQTAQANAINTDGVWTHVIGRWNGADEVALFINGVKQTTTATSASMKTDTGAFSIGTYSTSYLNGHADEVVVFDRALTDAEILSLATHGLDGARNGFDLYYASTSVQPTQVFRDGLRLTLAASKVSLASGMYWWDSGNERIYVFDNPSGHTVEASQRSYAVQISGRSYLTVQDLTLTQANAANLYASGNSNWLRVINNTLSYAGTAVWESALMLNGASNCLVAGNRVAYSPIGIYLSGYGPATTDNNLVSGNTVSYTSDDGIEIGPGGDRGPVGNLITQNSCSYSNQTADDGACIHVFDTGTGNIISYNVVFNSGTASTKAAGIMLDTPGGGTEPTLVAYNVGYGNTNGCIDVGSEAADLIYNNTCYNNNTQSYNAGELNTFSPATGFIFKNNLACPSSGKYVTSAYSVSGTTFDYNFYCSGGAASAFYGDGTAYSFVNWQGAITGDAHSSSGGDPLFTNAGAGNFTLQPGSPAIGTGVYIPGVSTANPPNIGAK